MMNKNTYFFSILLLFLNGCFFVTPGSETGYPTNSDEKNPVSASSFIALPNGQFATLVGQISVILPSGAALTGQNLGIFDQFVPGDPLAAAIAEGRVALGYKVEIQGTKVNRLGHVEIVPYGNVVGYTAPLIEPVVYNNVSELPANLFPLNSMLIQIEHASIATSSSTLTLQEKSGYGLNGTNVALVIDAAAAGYTPAGQMVSCPSDVNISGLLITWDNPLTSYVPTGIFIEPGWQLIATQIRCND